MRPCHIPTFDIKEDGTVDSMTAVLTKFAVLAPRSLTLVASFQEMPSWLFPSDNRPQRMFDWPRFPGGGLVWHILMNPILVEDMFDDALWGSQGKLTMLLNKMTTKIVRYFWVKFGITHPWDHRSCFVSDLFCSVVFSLRRSWIKFKILSNKTITTIVW